ncbi:MAG TPA: hypothetical protein VFQ43_00030, partial [Nitrososphaera sp.]|nr:hypothetical protein [Nitrososphaera sp.]
PRAMRRRKFLTSPWRPMNASPVAGQGVNGGTTITHSTTVRSDEVQDCHPCQRHATGGSSLPTQTMMTQTVMDKSGTFDFAVDRPSLLW